MVMGTTYLCHGDGDQVLYLRGVTECKKVSVQREPPGFVILDSKMTNDISHDVVVKQLCTLCRGGYRNF